MPILIIAIMIALFVAGAFYAHHMSAKRREELAAWAMQHGLSFSAEKEGEMDHHGPTFAGLRRGDSRYAYNIMRGSWQQRDMIGFDYHYQTCTTDNKGRRQTHHHYFSAVIITSSIPLKPLLIRPEGFFDKMTEFFGADDIDFESAEFSRKFFVKSPDRRWAFDVLHARTMEFLLGQPMFQMQFARQEVMIWRDRTFKVHDFEAAADVVTGVLDRFPEYLIRQQKGQS